MSAKCSQAFVAQGIEYFRCLSCTHVFALRVLEQPYEDYNHADKYDKWKEYLHNVFKKRVQDILRHKKKGKALDVGASLGYFVDELSFAGFSAEGLEPSADAIKLARSRGLRMHKGYLGTKKLPSNSYDVIVLNHTLEHIKDPIQAIKDIYKLLRPNGIVCIESPNFASIEAMISQSRWRYLYPTEHYSQFTPQSLKTLLIQNGFTVESTRTYAAGFDFASLFAELRRCIRELDWKRLLVYIIEFPLSVVEILTGTGAAVQCIARKKGKRAKISRTKRLVL